MKTRIFLIAFIGVLAFQNINGQYRSKNYKASVGAFMGAGFGFESFPIFYDENGDEITLSTGGGLAGGLDIGYDILNSLNLSMQIFYQGSSPSKALKNASGSFNRMGITITPAFIIPIKGGNKYRLMPGAGAGFYTMGTMKVDATEIGGEEMTFKYESTIGFHVSLMFQINFSPRSTLGTGLKYYNIAYTYTEEGSTHISTDNKILEPNGSGLDIILGYYFRF